MPHPATDAHVHLAKHPGHSSAVIATLTGSDIPLARALLSAQGFRPAGEQTMVLARIDYEEPYYAHQAARALREDGVTVDIAAYLQRDIDTEWTWAAYPMPWLSRDEVREVSDEAQKIHDDIISGRLTIHLHAHDGWTTVAVGTYRYGESIGLHGENHLRQVTHSYDSPAEAIAEFERLHRDACRPGPAPATDTERAAAQALNTTIPTAQRTEPGTKPKTTVTMPVYAADAGDHEALLANFLGTEAEWDKVRTWGDGITVAGHESRTLNVEFVHEADPADTTWTIAAYESPVGERIWRATATASTPAEVVRTLLDTLASEDARSNCLDIIETTSPLAEAGWQERADRGRVHWQAPGNEPAGVVFGTSIGGTSGTSDGPDLAWTFWGGNTADQPAWTVHASRYTPPSVLRGLATHLAHGLAVRPTSSAFALRQAPTAVRKCLPPSPPTPASERPARQR